MTNVVIQPSYGNRAAREHWADTLDREREFEAAPLRDRLTDAQHAALKRLHPTGRARFWGATASHDRRMDSLTLGDVVLFTGGKLVRAVGEVGVSFRNAAVADELWSADPDKGSWHNVYSLLTFERTDIPYEEIWALDGFNEGDNFMGLRFLDEDKAQTVLQGLRITTSAELAARAAAEQANAAALAQFGHLVPPEAVHVDSTGYDTDRQHVLVNRAEALLVEAYRRDLDADLQVRRLRTRVGVTDLHVTGLNHVEIVDAKSGSGHLYVRQALGQLLDYAAHAPTTPTRLTGLFPDRPTPEDVALLHRFGIDCAYRTPTTGWRREAAPPERYLRVKALVTS